MSTASPTAFLVWAILAVLFLGFLFHHIWSYDKFKCLLWSSGRQPGAFKRVMTYSYLGSVPLFTVYSVALTVIKFKEGFIVTPDMHIVPTPLNMYSPGNKHWILPLDFVFSFAWALELVTHLEELAFWLYLLHQNPQKEEWFNSWEYRLWSFGTIVAILGMPLTALVTRKNVDTCDAWIFLVGSSGSTTTTVCFLYVLWRFPRFIRHVKAQGADPSVVVRLATFYQLNLVRVVFRFLFTIPLFALAIDGIVGGRHPINRDLFWTDFLTMIAGIGCFISTMITLLIFFPRSIVKESGYKPKLPTVNSPNSPAFTPPLSTGIFEVSSQSNFPSYAPAPDGWDDPDDASIYHHDQAPPYAGIHDTVMGQYAPPFRPVAHEQVVYQRQPFPHSLSSPHIASPTSPPVSPQQMRVALPPRRIGRELQRAGSGAGLGFASSPSTSTSSISVKRVTAPMVQVLEHEVAYLPQSQIGGAGVGGTRHAHGGMHRTSTVRAQPRTQPEPTGLHPYIMSFTSPIDLADIPSRTI